MRLMFVVHGFPPDQPGVWTYHHVHELATRHEICVFALATDSTRQHYEQWQQDDRGVLVWRLNNLCVDHLRGFTNPQIDTMVENALEYFQPDVVHCEHVIGLSTTLLTRTWKRRIPTVLALYDYYWVCPRVNLVRGDYSLCDGPSHTFDCVTCVDGPGVTPPRRSAPHAAGWPHTLSALLPFARQGGIRGRGDHTGDNRDVATHAAVPEPWRLLLHDYRVNAMRALIDYPDVITACSNSLRDDLTRLLDLPPGRIRTVSLGVPALPAARQRTAHDRVHVAYLGSIAPHKGVHVLAQAAAQLTDLPVEYHLHGAAVPQYLNEVLAQHVDITHHGSYRHEDLGDILSETDILVLPTLSRETFSFVIREATLAGVPIVASRLGSIPEFIRDGENGLLVTPGSVTDLATALRRLVVDPNLRTRLAGTPAAVRPLQQYSAEMEQVYIELARQRQENRV